MVYFQCETCCETLKKKQVENHYSFQCSKATHFMCLSCQGLFDRETIKAHTSCITEEEKYQKGDNMKKPKIINNQPKPIVPVDIDALKWSGFRKTSKKILMSVENYKMDTNELLNKLALVYANSKDDIPENVDMQLMKKYLLEKLEENSHFIIDLGKNTIRYKSP